MPESHARTTRTEIRRFAELNQREIRVLLFLKMCKNARSGRCNPTRATIAESTGLRKSHLSVAVHGLRAKGWIIEGRNGFEITELSDVPIVTESVTIRQKKVTESVTKKLPDRELLSEKKLPDRELKVTDPVLKVTDSVTSRNIVFKQTRTNKGTNKKPAADGGTVEKIFLYYKSVHGKSERFSLTDLRRRRIVDRLKRYSVADLMEAIDGCKKSPHHQGDNLTGTFYDDIELILRSDTQLEKMIENNARRPIRPNRPADIPKPAGSDRPCATCDQARFIDDPDGGADPLPCPRCSTDSYDFVIRQRRGTIAA